jgi:hypothetical protein
MTRFPHFHPIWKAADAAAGYTLILIALLLLFAGGNWAVRRSGWRRGLSTRTMRVLSAGNGFLNAILAGLLMYFGIENYKTLLEHLIEDRGLINLVSVSIVTTVCLLCAAFFHDTISVIAGERLEINPFRNVASYALARFLVVSGIVAFTSYAVSK